MKIINSASLVYVLLCFSLVASDEPVPNREVTFPVHDPDNFENECISCFEEFSELKPQAFKSGGNKLCESCFNIWCIKGHLKTKIPDPCHIFSSPQGQVASLNYSSDGQQLVSVYNTNQQGRIVVWCNKSGQLLRELLYSAVVECAYPLLDSESFLIFTMGRSFRIVMPHFNEDEVIIHSCSRPKMDTGLNFALLPFNTGTDYIFDMETHTNIALAHNAGKTLCSSIDDENNVVVITGEKGSTTFWSTREFEKENGKRIKIISGKEKLKNAAHSPSCNRLATVSLTDEVSVISFNTDSDGSDEKKLCVFATPDIQSLLFDGTGNRLFILDQKGQVWVRDANTGKVLFSIYDFCDATNAQFSPDGNFLALARSNGHLLLLNANTGENLADIDFFTENYIGLFAFSPNGEQLAVAFPDGSIRIWSIRELVSERKEC